MLHIGWLVRTPSDAQREDLLEKIPGLLCEHFQLCAAVGCACLTGQGAPVCHEWDGGKLYPSRGCEGPTWSAAVVSLENSIRIDLHLKGPLIGSEYANFTQALYQFNLPTFTLPGSGVNHY